MPSLHSIRKSLIKKQNIDAFWNSLYPYQQESINKFLENIDDNFKGQVILPTGAGKTKIMEYLTGELINKYNDYCSFAVFCHRLMLANNLLERIVNSAVNKLGMEKLAIITMHSGEVNKFAKSLHENYNLKISGAGFNDPDPQIRISKFNDYDTQLLNYIDDCKHNGYHIMFAVLYQSMTKLLDLSTEDKNGNKFFDFAFYDEAHTTCSNRFLDNIIPVGNYSNINLFFTATPTSDKPGHDMTTEEIFGKKIIELYPKDLIYGKYICPIKVIIQDLTNKTTAEVLKDENSLQSAIESIRNGFISLQEKINKDSKGKKNAILFVSVRGNKYLKEIFQPKTKEGKSFKVWRKNNCVDLYFTSAEMKGEIDFYDKDDPEDLHELDKEDFIMELNKIDGSRKAIVINIDQLSEGIDVPNMNGAMYLRGSSDDASKFIQFIGRTVRRADEDRDLILNNDIQWDDEDKYIKPCSYVYIAQSYLENSVTKETIEVLDKIYAAYGDIIFRGTYTEDMDGTNKAITDNPTGKQDKNKNKAINGFEALTSYKERIKNLLNGNHMDMNEKKAFFINIYTNLCNKGLTEKANELYFAIDKLHEKTQYENEYWDLVYDYVTTIFEY